MKQSPKLEEASVNGRASVAAILCAAQIVFHAILKRCDYDWSTIGPALSKAHLCYCRTDDGMVAPKSTANGLQAFLEKFLPGRATAAPTPETGELRRAAQI
jgi:hypothetical protein